MSDMLEMLKAQGIVAVIRAKDHAEAKGYIEACRKGGILAVELTYSIPDVASLIAQYNNDKELIVGVGSVLTADMAIAAINAGAKYVVSPGFDQGVNDVCAERKVPYLPGCMTVTEIMYAMSQGNKMVKLFPGNLFGAKYVKAIKAPIPQVQIMPTGGVDIDNVEDWFKMGVSCVGVGSSLFKAGSLEDISALAAQFVEKIKKVRV